MTVVSSVRRGRRGFTLIELLVVIAIIAILASILFPVFSRARAKARQSSCQSNMKQLTLAMLMYADDYDELLPQATPNWAPDPDTLGPSWDVAIFEYMRNSELLICPERKQICSQMPGCGCDSKTRGYAQTKYTTLDLTATPPVWCNFLGYYPDVARTVLLTEKGAYGRAHLADASCEQFTQAGGGSGVFYEPDGNVKLRHNGGNNFAYVDGHVKTHAKDSGPFAETDTARGGKGLCGDAQDWPGS